MKPFALIALFINIVKGYGVSLLGREYLSTLKKVVFAGIALTGREVIEDVEVSCGTTHSGRRFTNNSAGISQEGTRSFRIALRRQTLGLIT